MSTYLLTSSINHSQDFFPSLSDTHYQAGIASMLLIRIAREKNQVSSMYASLFLFRLYHCEHIDHSLTKKN